MTLDFKVKQQSTVLPASTDLETKRKLILKNVYKIPVEIMDRNAVHVLKNLGKLN